MKFLLSSVAALVLTACGGGGDGADKINGVDISNEVSPTTLTVNAGSYAPIDSFVRAKASSVISNNWTVVSDAGVKSNIPQVVDAACVNASTVAGAVAVGNAGSTSGESRCSTNVIIPDSAASGDWKLVSTSKSATGYTGVSQIALKVVAQPASSLGLTFNINAGKSVGFVGVNQEAKITGDFDIVVNRPVEDYQFTPKWTQVGGPAAVVVQTDGPTRSSKFLTFTAPVKGEYVFKYSVTFSSPVIETREAIFVAVAGAKAN